MAWNKSGIKDITINFSLTRLIKELESNKDFFVPPKMGEKAYKEIARKAKDNIQNSSFTNNPIVVDWDKMKGGRKKGLRDSTKYVRNWRGNPTGPPLIETGKLLNSIRATKNGIEMEEYGQYHLKGYKTVKNKFTEKFNMVGKDVPSRNFLHSMELELPKEEKQKLLDRINKKMRTNNKSLKPHL
tara:strand:+ start:172 stop:726 length:555 start_codon:yes stop_codon:yes gene_type:complete